MGFRDIPFWGRVAGEVAGAGIDRLGSRTCARKGHKWRDVSAIVLKKDGSAELMPRGTAQRCARCGAEREKPQE